MLKIFQGITFLCLGVVSLEAFANNMINHSTVAQEVVIPGYSLSSPADKSSQDQTNLTQIESGPESRMDSTNLAPADVRANAEQIINNINSCKELISNGMSIDAVKTNLQEQFNYSSMGHTFSWPGQNGQPETVISFLDNGKPVEATGLFGTLAIHAKDLNFTLQDALKASPDRAQLKGNIYLFLSKDGDGQIIIYTDLKNMVTSFSATEPCESKEKPS